MSVVDMNQFIQEQKSKLAQDRQNVHSFPKTEANQPGQNDTQDQGLALDGYKYEKKRKTLLEEKRKEYNDLLAGQGKPHQNHSQPIQDREVKENIAPRPRPADNSDGIMNNFGGYESHHKKLQEERKQEYNRLLAEKNARGAGSRYPDTERQPAAVLTSRTQQQDDGEYVASLPGLRDHSSAEYKKMMERNKEYNELLRAKSQQPRSRSQADRHAEPASDDYSQVPAPRRGWTTPTYDEILEKKRKEENNYRKHYDPDYSGLHTSRSETNLNKPMFDNDRGFNYLDKEYEKKKVRFEEESSYNHRHVLKDPRWLDPPSTRQPSALSDPTYLDGQRYLQYLQARLDPSLGAAPAAPPSLYSKQNNSHSPRTFEGNAATLEIGTERTISADQRQKEAYRRELQRQMQIDKELRERERQKEFEADAKGRLDAGGRPNRDQRQYPDDLFRSRTEPTIQLPIDEAYNYYSNRHPLEATLGLGGIGVNQPKPLSDRSNFNSDTSYRSPPQKPAAAPATTPFPVDDHSKTAKDNQRAYQEELKRQIEEQKAKKKKVPTATLR